MPAFAVLPASEEFEVRTIGTALDDCVLFFRLVAVVLQGRVEPRPLPFEPDGSPAAHTEQQMFGLVTEVVAKTEPRLDPCQAAAVREAPGLHDQLGFEEVVVRHPEPEVGV